MITCLHNILELLESYLQCLLTRILLFSVLCISWNQAEQKPERCHFEKSSVSGYCRCRVRKCHISFNHEELHSVVWVLALPFPRRTTFWHRLGDELSMHVATAFVLHRVFTFDKSLSVTVVSGAMGATLMSAFIFYHCWTDELFVHEWLFGKLLPAPISQKQHSPFCRKRVC